jgi:hypothetical protein
MDGTDMTDGEHKLDILDDAGPVYSSLGWSVVGQQQRLVRQDVRVLSTSGLDEVVEGSIRGKRAKQSCASWRTS